MVNAVMYSPPPLSSFAHCEHNLHLLTAVGRIITFWAKQAVNSVSRWNTPIMRMTLSPPLSEGEYNIFWYPLILFTQQKRRSYLCREGKQVRSPLTQRTPGTLMSYRVLPIRPILVPMNYFTSRLSEFRGWLSINLDGL